MKTSVKIFLLAGLAIWLCQCGPKKQNALKIEARDTTITKSVAFSELFMDSLDLAKFIARTPMHDSLAARLTSFYNRRNYQYAWFFPNGIADYVFTFLGMQNQYLYYSGDSTIYLPGLQARIDSLAEVRDIHPGDSLIRQTELLLTYQFFRYAYFAYAGDRRVNQGDLGWFIPRKKLDLAPFLDSLLANKGKRVEQYEPVNRQYRLLRTHLLRYYGIRNANRWDSIPPAKKALRKGESTGVVPEVRKRLMLLGFEAGSEPDSLEAVTPALLEAVAQFEQQHGLASDNTLDREFFDAINVPITKRIQQILINMERIRWMPDQPDKDYLLVNIPEFRLHAYENGKLAFQMDVVVGSAAHHTVVFQNVVSQVVFSPYWNVPPGIMKNEILPAIARDPNYLARNRMEWHGTSVRQKPGPGNSLGRAKFLFPNSYNIYLHDTPAKRLFKETRRAFSHGCIRVSDAKKLAEFLLRKDSTWTAEKIEAAMESGKEKVVRLKKEEQVQVVIGYFTAWVDKDGKLNFRNDVYGHDQKMIGRYFAGKPAMAKTPE